LNLWTWDAQGRPNDARLVSHDPSPSSCDANHIPL
jgi:hypothetical protein